MLRGAGAVPLAAARHGLTADQARCTHTNVLPFSNQYGCWRKCANCNLRTYYKDKAMGRESTRATFIVNDAAEEVYLQDGVDVTMILEIGRAHV